MLCRQCNTELVPFGIYLNFEDKDGHICPNCGFWIYNRVKVDRAEPSALVLAIQARKKRGVKHATISME